MTTPVYAADCESLREQTNELVYAVNGTIERAKADPAWNINGEKWLAEIDELKEQLSFMRQAYRQCVVSALNQ
jgi:hypothetical protein